MRLVTAAVCLLLGAPADTPPARAVAKDCYQHRAEYTLVRKDVLATLNASDKNLPVCEEGLRQAQDDLTQAKADLIALQKAAIELRANVAELKAHKRVLEGHITKLEGMTCPETTWADKIAKGWDNIDGVVGIGTGYALGTGMCIGIAWVFNQPDFQ